MRVRSLIVLLVLLASPAWAQSPDGPTWRRPEVVYYVNPANSPFSADATVDTLKAAAQAWNDIERYGPQLVYGGLTDKPCVEKDDEFRICFQRGPSDYTGYTKTWHNAAKEIYDADIIFYPDKRKLFLSSQTCSGVGTYLQDLATHEFGHSFGLAKGHGSGAATGNNHITSNSQATMYATMRSTCSTAWRSLHDEDIKHVRRLYATTNSPHTIVAVTFPDYPTPAKTQAEIYSTLITHQNRYLKYSYGAVNHHAVSPPPAIALTRTYADYKASYPCDQLVYQLVTDAQAALRETGWSVTSNEFFLFPVASCGLGGWMGGYLSGLQHYSHEVGHGQGFDHPIHTKVNGYVETQGTRGDPFSVMDSTTRFSPIEQVDWHAGRVQEIPATAYGDYEIHAIDAPMRSPLPRILQFIAPASGTVTYRITVGAYTDGNAGMYLNRSIMDVDRTSTTDFKANVGQGIDVIYPSMTLTPKFRVEVVKQATVADPIAVIRLMPSTLPPAPVEICTNGQDDDGDGLADEQCGNTTDGSYEKLQYVKQSVPGWVKLTIPQGSIQTHWEAADIARQAGYPFVGIRSASTIYGTFSLDTSYTAPCSTRFANNQSSGCDWTLYALKVLGAPPPPPPDPEPPPPPPTNPPSTPSGGADYDALGLWGQRAFSKLLPNVTTANPVTSYADAVARGRAMGATFVGIRSSSQVLYSTDPAFNYQKEGAKDDLCPTAKLSSGEPIGCHSYIVFVLKVR